MMAPTAWLVLRLERAVTQPLQHTHTHTDASLEDTGPGLVCAGCSVKVSRSRSSRNLQPQTDRQQERQVREESSSKSEESHRQPLEDSAHIGQTFGGFQAELLGCDWSASLTCSPSWGCPQPG